MKNKKQSDASTEKTRPKEDLIALYYKEKIAKEANEVEEKAGKMQIFEFEQDMTLNENIPGVPVSFLDRLIHQITRPRASDFNDPFDDEFAEIDENEITTIINENAEEIVENLKNESPLKMTIRSFLEELGEETDVILGRIDEETLFNRRSHRVRSPPNRNSVKSVFFFF